MTFPSRINPECKPRIVRCENPTHPVIQFVSTVTQERCPICDNSMITVVPPIVNKDELAR